MRSEVSGPENRSSVTHPPGLFRHADPDAANVLAGKRVVVVEDEAITQMHLRKLLTRAGLRVAGFALDGAEGVAVVLRERPDIVLMDITMPGEFNGLEAMRRIRAELETCVVMLTAYAEYEAEAMASGACGYILKPIDSMTLIPQLVTALIKWQQHDGR